MKLKRMIAAVAAAVALAAACAPAAVVRRPAHVEYPPADSPEVWNRAVKALKARGYSLAVADPTRGLILTEPLELQAPCGLATCLARETVLVRVSSDGHAVVNVERRYWDAAARQWLPASEREAVDALEEEEVTLLREFVGEGKMVLRRSETGEPCGIDADCVRGHACLSHRCARTCEPGGSCPDGAACIEDGSRWVCARRVVR